MKLKHAKQKKVRECTVGEYVSIRVPCIDRTSTDPQQLLSVVIEVVGKTQATYRLCTMFGVLKTCYPAGELESYPGSYTIEVAGWEQALRVSLREAAKHSSP